MDGLQKRSGENELFELLASSRRRLLLYYLMNHDGAARLWDLSREIVAHEMGIPPEDVDSGDIRRVYISIAQTHLPVLEEYGLVEYDDTARKVYLDDGTDEVIAVLQNRPRRHRQWAIYYLVVTAVFGGLMIAHIFRLAPVSTTVMSVATLGAAATLLLLAMIHYWTHVVRGSERLLEKLVL